MEDEESFIGAIRSMLGGERPLPSPPVIQGPSYIESLEERDVLPKELLDEARQLSKDEIKVRITKALDIASKNRQQPRTIGLDPGYLIAGMGMIPSGLGETQRQLVAEQERLLLQRLQHQQLSGWAPILRQDNT